MAEFKAVHPTIPAIDLDRAMSWYADKLGLKPLESEDFGAFYQVGPTRFLLFPTPAAGTNQATAMTFEVDDIHAAVAQLEQGGVVFEEYELPGAETIDGVTTFEVDGRSVSAAWFKDSEGNTLALGTG